MNKVQQEMQVFASTTLGHFREGLLDIADKMENELNRESFKEGIVAVIGELTQRVSDNIEDSFPTGNLKWTGDNLIEIQERYQPDYDVALNENDRLIITWSKSRVYEIGEEIPDDEPAGK